MLPSTTSPKPPSFETDAVVLLITIWALVFTTVSLLPTT